MALNGLVKSLLHIYWRFNRPMTIGVRVVVQDAHDCVLLVRHTYVSGWYLPGGGVETGETFEDAVRKELMEETFIKCLSRPQLLAAFHNPRGSKRDHVLLYRVEDWVSAGEFVPNKEIAEIGFFPLDKLPAGATPATRRRLKEVFEGQAPPEYW